MKNLIGPNVNPIHELSFVRDGLYPSGSIVLHNEKVLGSITRVGNL